MDAGHSSSIFALVTAGWCLLQRQQKSFFEISLFSAFLVSYSAAKYSCTCHIANLNLIYNLGAYTIVNCEFSASICNSLAIVVLAKLVTIFRNKIG